MTVLGRQKETLRNGTLSLSTKGVSLEQSGADQCNKSRPTQNGADQMEHRGADQHGKSRQAEAQLSSWRRGRPYSCLIATWFSQPHSSQFNSFALNIFLIHSIPSGKKQKQNTFYTKKKKKCNETQKGRSLIFHGNWRKMPQTKR